jgi:hypothetical protein
MSKKIEPIYENEDESEQTFDSTSPWAILFGLGAVLIIGGSCIIAFIIIVGSLH